MQATNTRKPVTETSRAYRQELVSRPLTAEAPPASEAEAPPASEMDALIEDAPRRTSIRYDLPFQECLLRFVDDQLDGQTNPDGLAPSLEQEQHSNQSLMLLCDMIDIYCDRYAEMRVRSSRVKTLP